MTLSFGAGTRRIRGYSAGGVVYVEEPTAPSAPVITAEQSGDDPQTHLTIGLTGGMPARGDYIRLQYKLQSSSTWLDGPGSMVAGDFAYKLAVLVQESAWDVRAYCRNAFGESSASSTVQANTASPPSGNVIAHIVATGWDQTATDGGSITGPAPLSIHFDCTGSQSANLGAGQYVWSHLRAHADFGGITGTYTHAASSKDEHIGGLIFSRTFETPGTYNVAVRVGDGTDSDTVSVQIIVQDPADYFTNEVAVSTGGAWPTWANDTLYTLTAGGNYTAKGAINIPLNLSKIQIRGSSSSPPSLSGGITFSSPTGASFTQSKQIQFYGLNIASGAANIATTASYVTFSRVAVSNGFWFANGLTYYYGQYGGSNFVRPKAIALHECSSSGPGTASIGPNGYCIYSPDTGKMFMIEGGSYTIGAGPYHTIRITGAYKTAINNVFFSRAPLHHMTIRGNALVSYADNCTAGTVVGTEQFVVSRCVFGLSTDARTSWHVFHGPQNTNTSGRVQQGIMESCVFATPTAGSDRNMVFAGRHMVERNNTRTTGTAITTGYTGMTAADFTPNWADAFTNGFNADRIQNPTTFDPGAP